VYPKRNCNQTIVSIDASISP